LPEREAIEEVLGVLDDKIAANDAMLHTEDGLVRARYSVLVERVGAVSSLRDLATNVRIQVAPNDLAEHVPYVGLEHIGRRFMWLTDGGTSAQVTSAKFRFRSGDVLFGKLRPYFHKVAMASKSGLCSTDILVVRAKDKSLSGLVLAAASSDEAVERVNASSEGTRMPRAKWSDLAALRVPEATAAPARELSRDVLQLADHAVAIVAENRGLAEIRDALLPQLMSGRVRVKDAEKTIEGVV